jgi:hypothetical protein
MGGEVFEEFKLSVKGQEVTALYLEKMQRAFKDAIVLMPDGRAKQAFELKFLEAFMWGKKSISTKEGNHIGFDTYEVVPEAPTKSVKKKK